MGEKVGERRDERVGRGKGEGRNGSDRASESEREGGKGEEREVGRAKWESGREVGR